jgi:hypothetical protein
MNQLTTPAPETATGTRRQPALQARRISERLENIAERLQQVQNDSALRTQLAQFGYDDAKLAQGLALQTAAQEAYHARQQALTARALATAQAHTAFLEALWAYRNLRSVALSVIADPAVRTALAADTPIPQDKQTFVSVARAGYTAVQSEPQFAETLSAHGYPADVLANANALLDTLSAALSALDTTRAEAERATQTRNQALAALSAWVLRFERVAAVASRAQTDAARRIAHVA